ncbi:MAG: Fic family protein [Phycisphaerales bacterium]|nr:Fic family protein [Phycisphaerales bacterium]
MVRAEFVDVQIANGRPEQHHIQGYAFIPNPAPGVPELREHVAEIIGPLEVASNAVGKLDGFFRQAPGGFNIDPWILFQPLRLREARLSSKIENTIASAREVAMQAHRPAERPEPLEVRNYLRAMNLAAQAPAPMSESRIRAMHEELLRDVPDAERKLPGRYRDRQVYIGDERLGFTRARFVPPPAAEVPGLMHDLVVYLREPPRGLSALLALGLSHYQFETIHPFADGNGRVGRLLITLGLCDHGLLEAPLIYPSAYIDANKQAYYDALLAVSERGDWAGWLRFFLETVRSQAVDTTQRMHRLLELRDDYRQRVSHRPLSARIDRVIDHLFASPVVTARSLHEAVGGARQTVHNYIDLLVEAGILLEITGRKKDQIYEASEILNLADQD